MTEKEKIEIGIQAIAAVGTIILAVLAIFGPSVKKWFYKPKLIFFIKSDDPYVSANEEKEIFSDEVTKSLKISIQTKNIGNITALNTQMYTSKIFKIRQENKSYYLDREIIPSNYYWSDDETTKSLTPLMSHYVEIARIQKHIEYSIDEESKKKKENSKHLLFLKVPNPNEADTYIQLGKGTFLIPIKAYSDNLNKEYEFYVELFWNGNDLSKKTKSNFYVKQIDKSNLHDEIIKEL